MYGLALVFIPLTFTDVQDVWQIEYSHFAMPLRLAPDHQFEKVTLFVSVDQGKNWKRTQDFQPSDKEATFTAPRDGLYWFALQSLKKNGAVEPTDLKDLKPAMKVYVNTELRGLSTYGEFERQGFRVKYSERVTDLGEAARNLDAHLKRAIRAVPDAFTPLLRGVTLWIELDPTFDSNWMESAPVSNGDASGTRTAAHYVPIDFPSLREYDILPEKRGGIVIHADVCLEENRSDYCSRVMPGWLLHELAHAVHDQVLGFDNPEVKRAFAQAMERKLYEHVAPSFRLLGKRICLGGRAYAATNQLEYFAELSTGYLNCSGCTFPFSRDELRTHDPVGYALMESVWKTSELTLRNDMPDPVSLSWVAANGRRLKLFDLCPREERKVDVCSLLKLVGENMLSGDEYHFERPKPGKTTWHLTDRN